MIKCQRHFRSSSDPDPACVAAVHHPRLCFALYATTLRHIINTVSTKVYFILSAYGMHPLYHNNDLMICPNIHNHGDIGLWFPLLISHMSYRAPYKHRDHSSHRYHKTLPDFLENNPFQHYYDQANSLSFSPFGISK